MIHASGVSLLNAERKELGVAVEGERHVGGGRLLLRLRPTDKRTLRSSDKQQVENPRCELLHRHTTPYTYQNPSF